MRTSMPCRSSAFAAAAPPMPPPTMATRSVDVLMAGYILPCEHTVQAGKGAACDAPYNCRPPDYAPLSAQGGLVTAPCCDLTSPLRHGPGARYAHDVLLLRDRPTGQRSPLRA